MFIPQMKHIFFNGKTQCLLTIENVQIELHKLYHSLSLTLSLLLSLAHKTADWLIVIF